MVPKCASAAFIFWVVGVCGDTGPTQLNPSSGAQNLSRRATSDPLTRGSASGPELRVARGEVSLPSRGATGPRVEILGAGTPHASTDSSTSRSPSSVNRETRPTQDQPTSGARHVSEHARGSTGTSLNVPPAQHGHPGGGVATGSTATGPINRGPEETGTRVAEAPSLPSSPTMPAVRKPGSQPPLNQNVTRQRPRNQTIASGISSEGPLNDYRLVKPIPKTGNEGIFLPVREQDIPFLPGPLNEPPLNVFIFRRDPAAPRRTPRLPAILRMPTAW
uniref:Mucin 5ac n=1 Tax=Rhipicephalus zambeziensis TaxID=60191 RepID=A0A224YD55_9ACAR